MKTVLAALAVTIGLMAAIIPASAGYVSPDAGFATKAFTVGVP